MQRIVIQISYDGSDFSGWQIQKSVRTVQGTIERAISEIAKTDIKITGSGRTDSGVHALRQYAHFDFPIDMTEKQIKLALRTKFPNDIGINEVYKVKDDFHARYDAIKRTYKYFIATTKTPFNRRFTSYFSRFDLNLDRIKRCLPYFLGKHDFTSFSKFNPDINNYICNIKIFRVTKKDERIIFTISANRFLHHMVRRIIGTILNIVNNEKKGFVIKSLFKNKTPNDKLITTAPAQGLFLTDVKYSKEYRIQ